MVCDSALGIPRGGKFTETDSRMVGKQEGNQCLMSTEVQEEMMRKFWKRMMRWLYNIVNVLHATELSP